MAAAVVAVTVSLFLDEGVYGLINLIVTVVLVAIILAYVWPSKRNGAQSFAVAAALGLAFIPGAGFVVEVAYAPNFHEFVWKGDIPHPCITRAIYDEMSDAEQKQNYSCSYKNNPESKVLPWTAGATWLAVLLAVFAIDVHQQRGHPLWFKLPFRPPLKRR